MVCVWQTRKEKVQIAIRQERVRLRSQLLQVRAELEAVCDNIARVEPSCGCIHANLRLRRAQLTSHRKRVFECLAYLSECEAKQMLS